MPLRSVILKNRMLKFRKYPYRIFTKMQISLYIKFGNFVFMLPIDSKAVGRVFALVLILYFKIIFPFLFLFSFFFIKI